MGKKTIYFRFRESYNLRDTLYLIVNSMIIII